MKEWTVEQTARALGISRSAVYLLVKRGLLTRFTAPYGVGKGGRRVFFDREQVRALKDKRKNVLSTNGSG
jgi:predicted DNA-binding transcriptional regulator AlpA